MVRVSTYAKPSELAVNVLGLLIVVVFLLPKVYCRNLSLGKHGIHIIVVESYSEITRAPLFLHGPSSSVDIVDTDYTPISSYHTQVWSIVQPKWTCKIDEGSAGLVACCWAPDSRHILTTADFQLRMTLWSLVNKSISYIKYPKLARGGLDFSRDGKYMALAERRDCKDQVSLFDCSQWHLVRHFPVDTKDLAGLVWSPDGKVICIWDSVLDYKVLLYSIDGRCVASYSAYEHALGVKCVTWSPSSQFLAIGSYDQKVRILNHITWKTVADHMHSATVDFSNVVVYGEVEKKPTHLTAGANIFPPQSKYETIEAPVTVPSLKPDPEKSSPKLGVGTVLFSPDCKYIATKNDNMPNAVWVWDVAKLRLAVLLLQSNPVREFKWDPLQSRLAICTANSKLYLWSPAGCVSVSVPMETSFVVQNLLWHPSGTTLALIGSTHFCVCYLNEGSN